MTKTELTSLHPRYAFDTKISPHLKKGNGGQVSCLFFASEFKTAYILFKTKHFKLVLIVF